MKVALCTEILYPLFGVERRVYEMAKRLPEYGHDVVVYTSTPQKYFPEINIVQVSRPTIIMPPKRNYAFALQYWNSLFLALMKDKYDIIDANGHMSLFPCSLASFFRKKKVIATIHDLYLSSWGQMYSGRAASAGMFFELMSCKMRFDKVLTLNTSLKEKLNSIGVKDAEIVHSGVDIRHLDSIRGGKKEKIILYANRLVPQKNPALLLRAFAMMEEKVKLRIIGEGEERSSLERLADELGIEKRVKFLGKLENHDDVIREMKKSSVFALPSQKESFGISVIEAMACGTAVVSTRTQGPSDTITNGVNGFLAGGDEKEFAASLDEIMRNSRLRKRIEKSARKRAEEYDWDRIVRRIAEIYEEM